MPNKTLTAGITHVITAFANSSIFASDPVGTYTPFKPISDVRAMFDNRTQVCLAIGGWGDTEGFRQGLATEESRSLYASNIASIMDTHGFDCIDIDITSIRTMHVCIYVEFVATHHASTCRHVKHRERGKLATPSSSSNSA